MVKICGSSYTSRSCSSNSRNRCTFSPDPPRALRCGPSYISRSFASSLFRPTHTSFCRTPTTVILDPYPKTTTVISSQENQQAVAITLFALFAIGVLIASSISASRDCRFIETQCTSKDWWGDRECTPIYECNW